MPTSSFVPNRARIGTWTRAIGGFGVHTHAGQIDEGRRARGRWMLLEHYEGAFRAQPPEQLGGVKTTVANYLKYFMDPGIAEAFCPRHSTFSFDDLDRGKIVCVSLPQRYQVERRYLNTLLKLSFYTHALRRFDRPAAGRSSDNLLILWADEAQEIVTASDDGMSDYNVLDVIREARATVVAATQSYQSLMRPMGDERRAKVFIANIANRVTFCAADEESARIAADTHGKWKAKKRPWAIPPANGVPPAPRKTSIGSNRTS